MGKSSNAAVITKSYLTASLGIEDTTKHILPRVRTKLSVGLGMQFSTLELSDWIPTPSDQFLLFMTDGFAAAHDIGIW